jgi:hypothetical protein
MLDSHLVTVMPKQNTGYLLFKFKICEGESYANCHTIFGGASKRKKGTNGYSPHTTRQKSWSPAAAYAPRGSNFVLTVKSSGQCARTRQPRAAEKSRNDRCTAWTNSSTPKQSSSDTCARSAKRNIRKCVQHFLQFKRFLCWSANG